MSNTNKSVDFLDNDESGEYTEEQKKAHQKADVMHKLFYIHTAMKDSHEMNKANKQKASKSGRSRGGVLNGKAG
ncbi:TPA: hypothetical protein M2Q89_000690 [Escherichia coli]|nr:hypothetical protein [Escherichia coli]